MSCSPVQDDQVTMDFKAYILKGFLSSQLIREKKSGLVSLEEGHLLVGPLWNVSPILAVLFGLSMVKSISTSEIFNQCAVAHCQCEIGVL